MKTNLIESLSQLEEGELRVVISESTGKNISLSLRCAEFIAKESGIGNVLYLNTIQTSRLLGNSIRRYANAEFSAESGDERIIYETTPAGLLMDEVDAFEKYLSEGKLRYLIINCWEMCSKDYRRKSDLIYLLNSWMERYDVSILVFAEKMKSDPQAQKIQRGMGIGKLALIASDVKVIRAKQKKDMTDLERHEAWTRKIEKKNAEKIEARSKQLEEEKLLRKAEALTAESKLLSADVPIWKAEDQYAENAGIEYFKQNSDPMVYPRQGSYESDEHFKKRMLNGIAIESGKRDSWKKYFEEQFGPMEVVSSATGVPAAPGPHPDPLLSKERGNGVREMLR